MLTFRKKMYANMAFFQSLPVGSVVVVEIYGRNRKVKTYNVGFTKAPVGSFIFSKDPRYTIGFLTMVTDERPAEREIFTR